MARGYEPPKRPEKGQPLSTRLTPAEAAWWREQQDQLNIGMKEQR